VPEDSSLLAIQAGDISMGTYFALMDEAAKRGEDYEILDQISETLRRIEKGY
jgi:hypothetical protein